MSPSVKTMTPSDVSSTPPIQKKYPHTYVKRSDSANKRVINSNEDPAVFLVFEENKVVRMYPVTPLPNSEMTDEHEDWREFQKLKTAWKNGTAHLSSPFDIAMHKSYQRIMGMGEKALRLIFEEMTKEPDYWFWALRHITGENPTRIEHRGNIQLMTEDWLNWARLNSYL